MEPVTIEELIKMGLIFMGAWTFIKTLGEVLSRLYDRHDKNRDQTKKVDEQEKKLEEIESKMLRNIQNERDKIYEKYDKRLDDMERHINENHTDTGAKFQQVNAELEMLTDCMQAVLDGLHQLNCNGRVTDASKQLDEFINSRAHSQKET